MALERSAAGIDLLDVLDRVLDKGIVIGAWTRVSLVGIDLITVETRAVVTVDRGRKMFTFGNAGSSRSALPDDDDDDDSGGPPEGSGSSGAPALLDRPTMPRRRPVSHRERTRRR